MPTKQNVGASAPDNSMYVTLTDGAGNIQSPSAGTVVGAVSKSSTSGNVAAAVATATIAATAAKTNYITGFQVTGAGATAGAVVSVTVTGLLGGTVTYTYAAATGATVANQPLNVAFYPPIPASTTNTAIVVSCPSLGAGNTNNTVNVQGYTL